MILCVTPNAAIDFTMLVDELRPGQIHRASESFGVAGGKGVNEILVRFHVEVFEVLLPGMANAMGRHALV